MIKDHYVIISHLPMVDWAQHCLSPMEVPGDGVPGCGVL